MTSPTNLFHTPSMVSQRVVTPVAGEDRTQPSPPTAPLSPAQRVASDVLETAAAFAPAQEGLSFAPVRAPSLVASDSVPALGHIQALVPEPFLPVDASVASTVGAQATGAASPPITPAPPSPVGSVQQMARESQARAARIHALLAQRPVALSGSAEVPPPPAQDSGAYYRRISSLDLSQRDTLEQLDLRLASIHSGLLGSYDAQVGAAAVRSTAGRLSLDLPRSSSNEGSQIEGAGLPLVRAAIDESSDVERVNTSAPLASKSEKKAPLPIEPEAPQFFATLCDRISSFITEGVTRFVNWIASWFYSSSDEEDSRSQSDSITGPQVEDTAALATSAASRSGSPDSFHATAPVVTDSSS